MSDRLTPPRANSTPWIIRCHRHPTGLHQIWVWKRGITFLHPNQPAMSSSQEFSSDIKNLADICLNHSNKCLNASLRIRLVLELYINRKQLCPPLLNGYSECFSFCSQCLYCQFPRIHQGLDRSFDQHENQPLGWVSSRVALTSWTPLNSRLYEFIVFCLQCDPWTLH